MDEIRQVKYFKEIKEYETVQMDCLIRNVEAQNGVNSTYLKFTLMDGEKETDVNLFKDKTNENVFNLLLADDKYRSLNVTVKRVTLYKTKKGYLNLQHLSSSKEAKVSDFIPHAPFESIQMYDEIISIIKKYAPNPIENSISEIALSIYRNYKDDLLIAAAAYSMHHNIIGGLLYHTLTMLKAAVSYLDIYDLDAELLITGTALHDIGKLKEMNTTSLCEIEYTRTGNLETHLSVGMMMVEEENWKHNHTYDEERVELLKHMIASHHGKLEYGAIVLPKIPEAMLLSYIDNIDAKMYMFKQAQQELEPGTSSSKTIRGTDVRIYRPLK